MRSSKSLFPKRLPTVFMFLHIVLATRKGVVFIALRPAGILFFLRRVEEGDEVKDQGNAYLFCS